MKQEKKLKIFKIILMILVLAICIGNDKISISSNEKFINHRRANKTFVKKK